ncbi:MAG: hypothetical protein HY855_18705 [Burkholderiales bacterium]|nr:hypothetical protein [Burkholderiales bacterium]
MEALTTDERRVTLARYADTIEALAYPAPLAVPPLPYDICARIETAHWQIPMIDQLVRGELRELTNTLNEWHGALRRWAAWLDVVASCTDEQAWNVQWEFVESIAFQCLFYPSATRDRFSFVATNALHQVRLAANDGYKDVLDHDPKKPDGKPRFLSRTERETQLARIATPLPQGGVAFMSALQALDSNDYRDLTSNFWNLASHAIAPRLTIGLTNTVVREVRPATHLVEQPDRTFKEELIPGEAASVLRVRRYTPDPDAYGVRPRRRGVREGPRLLLRVRSSARRVP